MFFQSDEDGEDKTTYSKRNDVNFAWLTEIDMEGPQLSTTDFSEILDILKERLELKDILF